MRAKCCIMSLACASTMAIPIAAFIFIIIALYVYLGLHVSDFCGKPHELNGVMIM